MCRRQAKADTKRSGFTPLAGPSPRKIPNSAAAAWAAPTPPRCAVYTMRCVRSLPPASDLNQGNAGHRLALNLNRLGGCWFFGLGEAALRYAPFIFAGQTLAPLGHYPDINLDFTHLLKVL